jgi:superfamily I DNA and RNA helicase
MLDVVYGESRHRALSVLLAGVLAEVLQEGILYLGYPVLASADDRVFVDALLVGEQCGLVAFQIAEAQPSSSDEWAEVVSDQDRLYSLLESHLRRHDALRSGRNLLVQINTITVFGGSVDLQAAGVQEGHYCEIAAVPRLLTDFPPLRPDLLRALQGALQHVSTIKPAKRRDEVQRSDSRGAVLKRIEKGIANLDQWQRQAAIETPEGPQRIRGLAGSGKTIVLALKAAYLHAQHPDWRVVVTFHSRALYQQFEDLITRFTFEQTDDRPDFTRLQIRHSWGSPSREGVYHMIARHLGIPPRDFSYGLGRYGRDAAFSGICGELLEAASAADEPLFDAVLIDEAQDLPTEFFRMVHRFTRHPKRIAWAYDELQKLDEAAMPTVSELFGTDASGHTVITLTNSPGEARRDITLPICYRNSPWALATSATAW